MKCRIEVNMDNAAFSDSPVYELSKVLEDGILRLDDISPRTLSLRDTNGNKVGQLTIEED